MLVHGKCVARKSSFVERRGRIRGLWGLWGFPVSSLVAHVIGCEMCAGRNQQLVGGARQRSRVRVRNHVGRVGWTRGLDGIEC